MMNRPFLRVADPPSEEEFFNAVGEGKESVNRQMKANRDGFGVTADFFGKRIFSSLEKEETEMGDQ